MWSGGAASSRAEREEEEPISLVEKLGEGGFSTVWRCARSHDVCAVKRVDVGALAPDARTLLDNEIRIWRTLSHDCIVELLFVREDGPLVLLGMPLMDESLHARHTRMVRLGAKPRVVTILNDMVRVCRAMAYLHERGIVHRDLKSANILMRDDEAFVSDMGLARYTDTALSRMTAETGSYRWMAPEVFRHEAYGCACDVYSFALTAYEMLTLCVPFASHTPVETAFAVVRGHRPRLPSVVPDDLRRLVHECWSADAAARPPFADVVSRVETMRLKKLSFGSLEMSRFHVGGSVIPAE